MFMVTTSNALCALILSSFYIRHLLHSAVTLIKLISCIKAARSPAEQPHRHPLTLSEMWWQHVKFSS
jgi:hypothetical protein